MNSLETNGQQYENNIPYFAVTDAFKIYFETRNPKIREQLIYRYMPMAKRVALNFKTTSLEQEDLVQIAYETLLHCIDTYNPYSKNLFSSYSHRMIVNSLKMYSTINQQDDISLSNLDIYSNDDLEFKVMNKIIIENLIAEIKELLEKSNAERSLYIFKRLYGIDYELKEMPEIREKEHITRARISEIKNKFLLYLFLKLHEKYPYYPSETLKNIISDPGINWNYRLSKETKDFMASLELSNLEELVFHKSYDSLEDSHKTL